MAVAAAQAAVAASGPAYGLGQALQKGHQLRSGHLTAGLLLAGRVGRAGRRRGRRQRLSRGWRLWCAWGTAVIVQVWMEGEARRVGGPVCLPEPCCYCLFGLRCCHATALYCHAAARATAHAAAYPGIELATAMLQPLLLSTHACAGEGDTPVWLPDFKDNGGGGW